MISLIIGNKGSGKTKKIIALANQAADESKGNVVCVEKGKKLTFDVSHQARLVATDAYAISNYDAFYGFLAGICATNYDVTDVFVDATLRIGGRDYEALADFFAKLAVVAEDASTNFVFTVSCDESELPVRIFDITQKA